MKISKLHENTSSEKIISFLLKIFLVIWIVSIPLKNSIYQASIVILILLFLTDLYFYKSYTTAKYIFYSYKNIFISFGLIILSMTLSNAFGIQAHKAWYLELMYIIRYGLIFYILLYFYYKNYLSQKLILLIILASLSLQGIDGLYQHFFGIDFIRGHKVLNGAWLSGAVFYYNPFGMLMCIGASTTVALLFNHKQFNLNAFQITVLVILSLIFSYDLLYSLSRSSWVSFGVFIIFITAFNYKKINTKIIVLLCLLLFLVILFVINDSDISMRFQQLLQGDSSNRYEIWSDSIKAFLKQPLLGYGLNSFHEVISYEYNGTHNSVLEILLSMGIFGLSTFSYMLYLLIQEIIKNKNFIYFSFYASLFVISQFDNSIISSKIFLSILTLFAFFIFTDKMEQSHEI